MAPSDAIIWSGALTDTGIDRAHWVRPAAASERTFVEPFLSPDVKQEARKLLGRHRGPFVACECVIKGGRAVEVKATTVRWADDDGDQFEGLARTTTQFVRADAWVAKLPDDRAAETWRQRALQAVQRLSTSASSDDDPYVRLARRMVEATCPAGPCGEFETTDLRLDEIVDDGDVLDPALWIDKVISAPHDLETAEIARDLDRFADGTALGRFWADAQLGPSLVKILRGSAGPVGPEEAAFVRFVVAAADEHGSKSHKAALSFVREWFRLGTATGGFHPKLVLSMSAAERRFVIELPLRGDVATATLPAPAPPSRPQRDLLAALEQLHRWLTEFESAGQQPVGFVESGPGRWDLWDVAQLNLTAGASDTARVAECKRILTDLAPRWDGADSATILKDGELEHLPFSAVGSWLVVVVANVSLLCKSQKSNHARAMALHCCLQIWARWGDTHTALREELRTLVTWSASRDESSASVVQRLAARLTPETLAVPTVARWLLDHFEHDDEARLTESFFQGTPDRCRETLWQCLAEMAQLRGRLEDALDAAFSVIVAGHIADDGVELLQPWFSGAARRDAGSGRGWWQLARLFRVDDVGRWVEAVHSGSAGTTANAVARFDYARLRLVCAGFCRDTDHATAHSILGDLLSCDEITDEQAEHAGARGLISAVFSPHGIGAATEHSAVFWYLGPTNFGNPVQWSDLAQCWKRNFRAQSVGQWLQKTAVRRAGRQGTLMWRQAVDVAASSFPGSVRFRIVRWADGCALIVSPTGLAEFLGVDRRQLCPRLDFVQGLLNREAIQKTSSLVAAIAFAYAVAKRKPPSQIRRLLKRTQVLPASELADFAVAIRATTTTEQTGAYREVFGALPKPAALAAHRELTKLKQLHNPDDCLPPSLLDDPEVIQRQMMRIAPCVLRPQFHSTVVLLCTTNNKPHSSAKVVWGADADVAASSTVWSRNRFARLVVALPVQRVSDAGSPQANELRSARVSDGPIFRLPNKESDRG